jgi:transposase InsO family protein
LGGIHYNLLKIINQNLLGQGGAHSMVVAPDVQPIYDLYYKCSFQDVLVHQSVDREVSKLKYWLSQREGLGMTKQEGKELGKFAQYANGLYIDSNQLVRYRDGNQFVVPESQLEPLIMSCHNILHHAGRDKMLQVLRKDYFHPGLSAVVASVARECYICQCHKVDRSGPSYPVYRRNPSGPYALYAVDLMELPKSSGGFTCLLVGVDLYTKFGNVVPLRNKTSQSVAKAMESSILASTTKIPTVVLSDNGPEFRGKPFKDLLTRYGIQHENSIPYAAHTNGAVERLNQTIKEKLATVCHGRTSQWDKEIFSLIAQYNRTPHSSTGKAPVEHFQVTPAEPIVPQQKERYWRKPKRQFVGYRVGDLVLKKIPYQAAGMRNKLAAKYDGPHEVIEVFPDVVSYLLQSGQNRRKKIKAHISQLKKYYGEVPVIENPVTEMKKNEKGPEPPADVVSQRVLGIDWDLLRQFPWKPPNDLHDLIVPNNSSDGLAVQVDRPESQRENMSEILPPQVGHPNPMGRMNRESTPVRQDMELPALNFSDSVSDRNFSGFVDQQQESLDGFEGFLHVPPTPPLVSVLRDGEGLSVSSAYLLEDFWSVEEDEESSQRISSLLKSPPGSLIPMVYVEVPDLESDGEGVDMDRDGTSLQQQDADDDIDSRAEFELEEDTVSSTGVAGCCRHC